MFGTYPGLVTPEWLALRGLAYSCNPFGTVSPLAQGVDPRLVDPRLVDPRMVDPRWIDPRVASLPVIGSFYPQIPSYLGTPWTVATGLESANVAAGLSGQVPSCAAQVQTINPALAQTPIPALAQTPNPAFAQTINPAFAQSINPAYAQSINPAYAQSINPAYAPSINPAFVPAIHPAFVPQTMHPAFSTMSSPALAQGINPAFVPAIGASYGAPVHPALQSLANPYSMSLVHPLVIERLLAERSLATLAALQRNLLLSSVHPYAQAMVSPLAAGAMTGGVVPQVRPIC